MLEVHANCMAQQSRGLRKGLALQACEQNTHHAVVIAQHAACMMGTGWSC